MERKIKLPERIVSSPLGFLRLEVEENTLVKIDFVDKELSIHNSHPLLDQVEDQLNEYFKGLRKSFDIPLDTDGTVFQQEVWNALRTIPYGATCSYQEIAKQINRDKAVRAVGQANRRNPIPIIIPCHRVMGKNGAMTGYAGTQIDKKETLLNLEKQFS